MLTYGDCNCSRSSLCLLFIYSSCLMYMETMSISELGQVPVYHVPVSIYVILYYVCNVSIRKVEKVVTRNCQCLLKNNGYHSEKKAFLPLYAFQVQITKGRQLKHVAPVLPSRFVPK